MHLVKHLALELYSRPVMILPLKPGWIDDFRWSMGAFRLVPRRRIRQRVFFVVEPYTIACTGNRARHIAGMVSRGFRDQTVFATAFENDRRRRMLWRPHPKMRTGSVDLCPYGESPGEFAV